jgi:hypothetical protein
MAIIVDDSEGPLEWAGGGLHALQVDRVAAGSRVDPITPLDQLLPSPGLDG